MAIGGLIGWEVVLFIGLTLVFLITGGIVSFIILSKLRWPLKVVVFENLSGKGYVVSRRDRARVIGFGDGGEEIFLLKRSKKYRVGYGKRIGNKEIAWAVGEDGYWYNITLGDVDKKLLELGVIPVDRDMRYATASVRKGIENRYNEKSWMDKYGTILYFGLFAITLIIFGIVMWLAFNKQIEISRINAEAMKTTKEVMELLGKVLSGTENIQSGGSGLLPA